MKNMSRNEIAEVLKTRIPCFDNRVLYIMGGGIPHHCIRKVFCVKGY